MGIKGEKSPGFNALAVKRLKHAGFHLPGVLALLCNMYMIPLMKTLVVPIVKGPWFGNRYNHSLDQITLYLLLVSLLGTYT